LSNKPNPPVWLKPGESILPIISEWAKAAFLLNFYKHQDFYQMECGQNLPNQLPPALAGGIWISTNSFSGFSQILYQSSAKQ
jgi:hypothetical protein